MSDAVVVRKKTASGASSSSPSSTAPEVSLDPQTSTSLTKASNAINPPPAKRRKAGQPKSLPPFVKKLWSTVNDEENSAYIQWSDDGDSFRVVHREMFERKVLPKYYKHTNFSSFVRQLNMYGFHKVQEVQQTDGDCWKFESPYFKRGRQDLLPNIVRNRSTEEEESDDYSKIMSELQNVRSTLQSVSKDVDEIKKDNQMLWQENVQTKAKHKQHFETLSKVVSFLSAIYGQQRFQDIAASPKTQVQKLLPEIPTDSTPRNLNRELTNISPSFLSNMSNSNNNDDDLSLSNTSNALAKINDLDFMTGDTTSPTNSDRSEENDEQAQRILNNTVKAHEVEDSMLNSQKQLSDLAGLFEPTSTPGHLSLAMPPNPQPMNTNSNNHNININNNNSYNAMTPLADYDPHDFLIMDDLNPSSPSALQAQAQAQAQTPSGGGSKKRRLDEV